MSSKPGQPGSSLDIKIENLSKRFLVSSKKEESYGTLRSEITRAVRSVINPGASKKNPTQEFWALKNVSLEIRQGERIGLLGHNGAGKSTLLKILSRITPPTSGAITLEGRIASLLEVGTGFHGELTGRENIYLNGALLGMSRAEIKKCFDQILDFSGVEQFIDTPVKRYSTGMYTRLAFAVAAHLEADILLIDEVLAVGDVAFQEKCIGRINELSVSGRTILFVSHNMTAIAQVCDRGILLENGVVKADGPINQSIAQYLDHCKERVQLEDQFKDRGIVPTEIQISSKGNELISIGQNFEAKIELLAKKDISFQIALIVTDIMGAELFWLYPFNQDFTLKEGEKQGFSFSLEKLNLYPGNYWIGLWIGKGGWMDEFIYDRQLLRFTVTDNRSITYFPNFKPASVKVFENFSFEAAPPR
jgi:lipopolysaccharide transport system ATP-binding protein